MLIALHLLQNSCTEGCVCEGSEDGCGWKFPKLPSIDVDSPPRSYKSVLGDGSSSDSQSLFVSLPFGIR